MRVFLGSRTNVIRKQLLSGTQLRTRTCVSPRKEQPSTSIPPSPKREPLPGYDLPTEGNKPARTRTARRGAVTSHVSAPVKQARPRGIVASKVVYANIYDELGTMGNAFSYTVVVRNAISDLYLRIAVSRETKYVGRANPAKGYPSWFTFSQQRGSKPARTSMEGRSAVPSQISLGYRARSRTIVSSKAVDASIFDELGAMGHAFS